MKILIKVTKEILERSAMCKADIHLTQNCAISLAAQEIFPGCHVSNSTINDNRKVTYATLPPEARWFVIDFDHSSPEARRAMSPISFEIDVPSEVIEKIGIGEVYRILSESKTLELVEALSQ